MHVRQERAESPANTEWRASSCPLLQGGALIRGPTAYRLRHWELQGSSSTRAARGVTSGTHIPHGRRAGRRVAADAEVDVQVATETEIADVVIGDGLAWGHRHRKPAIAAIPRIADPVVVVAIDTVVGAIWLDDIGVAIVSAENVHGHVGIDTPAAVHEGGSTQPCPGRALAETHRRRDAASTTQGLVALNGLVALVVVGSVHRNLTTDVARCIAQGLHLLDTLVKVMLIDRDLTRCRAQITGHRPILCADFRRKSRGGRIRHDPAGFRARTHIDAGELQRRIAGDRVGSTDQWVRGPID